MGCLGKVKCLHSKFKNNSRWTAFLYFERDDKKGEGGFVEIKHSSFRE